MLIPVTPRQRALVPMTLGDVQAFSRIEPILKRLGLSVYCVRCWGTDTSEGGVVASNDPTDATVRISCDCSDRVYRRTPDALPAQPRLF
jgi:hypothetical protein